VLGIGCDLKTIDPKVIIPDHHWQVAGLAVINHLNRPVTSSGLHTEVAADRACAYMLGSWAARKKTVGQANELKRIHASVRTVTRDR
jgi:hypothetical protein